MQGELEAQYRVKEGLKFRKQRRARLMIDNENTLTSDRSLKSSGS
ncbi:hypothetical protein GXM_09206 [Nostoc sphaeroides CCNUC1]|uniref:Uncharacterized protein n=1 Tax=Nostoc sphaeroides CCNUC1 TaxID=2653204 RepID=A0A5P8WGR8_9NOSO|nr:hypothetical protein GXM_09206 [Nostoc sphaeroides CCNUC1]